MNSNRVGKEQKQRQKDPFGTHVSSSRACIASWWEGREHPEDASWRMDPRVANAIREVESS